MRKLQRQMGVSSPQLQGLAAQREVERFIKAACPHDPVTPIAPGRSGGDLLQEVRSNGRICGKVLWEVKDTDWSNAWVTKVKADGRRVEADYVVIATATFPKGARVLAKREGVILVAHEHAGWLSVFLHDALVELDGVRASANQRATKAAKILDYVTGPDCRRHFEAVGDAVGELRKARDREQHYHEDHWKREERLVSQIATASGAVRERLQAIARETPVKLVANIRPIRQLAKR